MRADRLIAELLVLQTRGKVSAAEMAHAMEVSQRTIYRDMLALNTAGIPVYAENGVHGGYQLVEGYRTQLTGLSREELQALFAMNIPAILGELGLDEDAQNVMRKLQASLSQPQAAANPWKAQRFLYDPTPWEPVFEPSVPGGVREILQRAIEKDQRVEIELQYWFRPGKLILAIAPYALVLKESRWYLVYQRENSFRVHSLEGIIRVSELGQPFVRDAAFDLSVVWTEWCRFQRGQTRQYAVEVQVKASALPAFSNQLHGNIEQVSPEENGWVRVACRFNRLEDAREQLLAWGGAVRVLAPEPLRLSMVDFARQFLTENEI